MASARLVLPLLVASLVVSGASHAQELAPADAAALLKIPAVQEAMRFAQANEPATIEEQVVLCEIPAPPFAEADRAQAYAERMRAIGLTNVRIDSVGNAIGERPGTSVRPTVVLAAHLDTVFPAGTDVSVKREGTVLRGPGISDDCRGLAIMLAIVRALDAAAITTTGTLLIVGTVGEEGLGNLRGARHLAAEELRGRIDAFVGIDGAGTDLTKDAVGSHRYRVTFRGEGGHSYGDFGRPNAIHALGRAIARIAELEVPVEPKTTFSVGIVEGGLSINAISQEAAFAIDLRSLDPDILADLDARTRRAVEGALAEENAAAREGEPLVVEIAEIGLRPAGRQPDDAPIVRAAVAAAHAFGLEPALQAGSTDGNAMIAAGIPTIVMDGGGKSEGAHSLDEWFDTTDSHLGTQWALLTALSLSGVSNSAAD
jgi:acetylornithine deacetylase/succinyl-diaminopimelate desuccinylase-like protein